MAYLKEMMERLVRQNDADIAEAREAIKTNEGFIKSWREKLGAAEARNEELVGAMFLLYPQKPRQWDSVFDIPRGTLVSGHPDHDLWITEDGNGWWVAKGTNRRYTVGGYKGWNLRERYNQYAPFVEVLGGIE